MKAVAERAGAPSGTLDGAHGELITHRLPMFAFGWLGSSAIWALILVLESHITPLVAFLFVAGELALLAGATAFCRGEAAAARARNVVIATCVALGVASTCLFAAVGGDGDMLAFILLTLYLASALAFAWGWRPAALVLVGTVIPWLAALPRLTFFLPTLELVTAIVTGSVLCLGIAEGSARSLRSALRHRAREEKSRRDLEDSRDAYRDLAENARDLIFSLDAGGCFTYVNEAFARYFGQPASAFIGRNVYELVVEGPEIAGRSAPPTRDLGCEGQPAQIIQVRSAGGPRWVETVVSAIRDGCGQTVGARCIARDVTERRRAERRATAQYAVARVLAEAGSLAEAAPRLLRAICENLDWQLGTLWVLDTDIGGLRCLEVWHMPERPGRAFAWACRTRVFAHGIGLPGRVWESARPVWISDVTCDENFPRAAAAATDELHSCFGFPIRLGSDVLGVIELFSPEIRLPDDDLLDMMTAVGSQIGQFSERKQAEEALRESEERYRGLVESQHDLIARFDRHGRFTFVNDAYCEKLGRRRAEFIGRSFQPFIHADDREARRAAMQGLDAPPYRACVETRSPTPEGWRWISWEACAVRNEHGTVVEYQAVGRDVTERRSADEALRASVASLRGSEERLRRLAQRQVAIREEERKRLGFDLHDDVCQELVGTQIFIESVRRRLAPVPPAAAADLDRVVRSLGEVVEHLRLLARDLRPMLLHDLGLQESLRSLVEGMSTGGTTAVVEFPTPIPRLDEETEVAIYRIAQGALANAGRHAAAHTIAVTLTVEDTTVRLEVRDDGRGFRPEDSRRSKALGLVSMEERALAVGGRFEVHSEPGKGTTVRLVCPLALRAPANAA